MTTTNSKTELASKRITKANLNQLANSLYGEDAYCEHIRSGKRGWYLYKGTQQTTFLGTNAMEAFDSLQIQENTVETTVSEVSDSLEDTTALDTSVQPETTADIHTQHGTTDVPVTAVAPMMLKETVTTVPDVPIKQETTDPSLTQNEALAVSVTPDETNTDPSIKIDKNAKAKAEAKANTAPSVKIDKNAKAKAGVQKQSSISSEELLEILLEKFPKTFFREPEKIRPVQKYIHKKIRQALNNEYTKDEISATLALYTQSLDYCKKLMEGGERIDLEGNPCGEISQQHMEDAKNRVLGEMPMRLAKKKVPKAPRVPLPHPHHEQLVCGKMEICLKINDLPADSKTLRNGWEEFFIDTNGYMVKTTVRPRTWKKLQKAAQEYSSWIANIRGKMGSRVKGGFELLMPGVQIFEKNPQNLPQLEEDKTAVNEKTATEEKEE